MRFACSPSHPVTATYYYNLLQYFVIAGIIVVILFALAYTISLSTIRNHEKGGEYECGFAPFDNATRLPFDVQFYLVGILFLIFDVEVALLLPWVANFDVLGWTGFWLVDFFIFVLLVAFYYEWRLGALSWPTSENARTW